MLFLYTIHLIRLLSSQIWRVISAKTNSLLDCIHIDTRVFILNWTSFDTELAYIWF